MYNSIRTAIRFTTVGPPPNDGDYLDLHVLPDTLLPFQFERSPRSESIVSFNAVLCDGSATQDVLALCDSGDEPYIVSFVGKDIIIYKAEPLLASLNPGRYYLTVSDGVDTWYSLSNINVSCYTMVAPSPIPIFDNGDIMIDDNNNLII